MTVRFMGSDDHSMNTPAQVRPIKVDVKHDVSASGRDEGYSLTITKYAHGWSTGELTLENLAEIRDSIDRFLAQHPADNRT